MNSEQLARYLAGEASQEERSQVESWRTADAANAAELAQLTQVWAAKPPAETWNVDFAWSKVASGLDRVVVSTPAWQRAPVRWLAAAGLVAAAGTGWWFTGRTVAYQTGVGQSRDLVLADGSKVVLAPASRLELGSRYGNGSREVALEGRAWFEVQHDEVRPFRVHVGQAMVEDLGTEFEVDATGRELKVAVVAGSVALSTPTAPRMTLGPRDVARVNDGGQPAVAHEVAVDRLITWRKGSLNFDNRSVAEVLAELTRWHDVEFKADPAVLGRSFTGTLPTTSLDDALAILSTSVVLTANRSGRIISLAFKAAP